MTTHDHEMRLCSDGIIRTVYIDGHERYVVIDGQRRDLDAEARSWEENDNDNANN